MGKPWFTIPGVQDGDRTLDQQLKGLEPLLAEIRAGVPRGPEWDGRRKPSVLDLGCAEGLISRTCMEAGAQRVMGMDSNLVFIERALSLGLDPHFATFILQDLNESPDADDLACCWSDIVLMLAVAHKMRDPAKFIREWAQFASGLLVIRLPASTPGFVKDERSGFVVFDITGELQALGFKLERVEKGHFDEWTGYFRRAA